MRSWSVRRILVFVIAVLMVLTATPLTVATDKAENKLVILAPYRMPWLANAAKIYTHETGVEVVIKTHTSKSDYENRDEASTEYLIQIGNTLKSETADLILTLNLPIELVASESLLANLYATYVSSSQDYRNILFSNIFEGIRIGGSINTMPLSFDAPTLLVNMELLGELGYEYSSDVWTLEEYTDYFETASGLTDFYVIGAEPYGLDKYNSRPYELVRESGYSQDYYTQSERFIPALQAFQRYYRIMRQVNATGSDYLVSNSSKVLAGEVLFQPINLSEAVPFINDCSFLGIKMFPTSDPTLAGGFITATALSVTDAGNKAQAVDFIKFMLTAEIQSTITAGIPINRAAAETKFGERADELIKVCESLTHRGLSSVWDDTSMPISAGAIEALNAIAADDSVLTDAQLMDHAKTLNNDYVAFRKLYDQNDKTIGTFLALSMFAMGILIIGSVILAVVMLINAVRSIVSTIKENVEIMLGDGGRYGKQVAVSRAKPLVFVIMFVASLCAIIVLAGLSIRISRAEDVFLSLGSKDALPEVALRGVYTIIALLVILALQSLSALFLSRVIICEKALLVSKGMNSHKVFIDEIDAIIIRPSSVLIQPAKNKAFVLQYNQYRKLKEMMNNFTKHPEFKGRILKEADKIPARMSLFDHN